ncbi:VWA-like domain-containing protein [Solirubrobacter phytolaccae]|uniref:VWA-like domain-containing protein n=1 Tax=Solirubrobacter phytolaccae TaxID=1404360 RepID=A0A9X3SDD0_9ACTN|nr:VWA-like domain-containing protein [Solirubrobacter phytolaccae]MDA0183545.1 VWA-like domain-containing protein [Solirubrobacter phytolaccae]
MIDAHKVAAARVAAAARLPYLASALFATTVRADPGSGTIGVDRAWTVRADPAVVEALPVDQLARLLIHLTAHVVRDHAGRADGLDRREHWNRAADAEINDDLEDAVPDVAPDRPEDLGCEPGRFAEHYYEAGAEGPRRWDCGSGADGRPDACEDGIGREQAALLRLGTAAEIHAQPPGTVPGGWQRWAESVLPSKVDWRRVLAAEVRAAVAAVSGMVDYSYRRPARRPHPDVLLPALVRPVPDVAIVVDTSGSMHDELLARALAEVEAVLKRAGLRRVRVLAVDTAVHAVRSVSRAAQVELAGGGGTDMGAGIEAAAVLRPRPSVVVVLTDGFTPWPDRPPRGIRVVVGLLSDGWHENPPEWARTVVIEGA